MTIQRILELAAEGAATLHGTNVGNPDGSEHVYAAELAEVERLQACIAREVGDAASDINYILENYWK